MSEPRGLTARERDVLVALIENGARDDSVSPAQDAAERRFWRSQVDEVRVWERCGCDECPSIELGDADGPTHADGPRVVLDAATDGALLLLFVDDNQLSYLELAAIDDDARSTEFPPVDSVLFSGRR